MYSENLTTKSSEPLSIQYEKPLQNLENAPLSSQGIFLVALVFLGIKPATEVALTFQPGYAGYTEEDYEQDIQYLTQVLSDLDLQFVVDRSDPDEFSDDPTIWTSFYISKEKETAQKLQKVFAENDQEMINELLGFPKTAIEAYPEKSLQEDTFPDEVKNNPAISFLYFRPSSEHWKEELAFVNNQINEVKKILPNFISNHDKSNT